MARHGRRPSPAPATRPVGFSPATNHATCFSPVLRQLQGEQPQARPTGFSRNTRHETRLLCFCRCFPARCGAASGGYGAAWAAAVPRAGNTACWLFTSTNHATCFSPALRRLQGEQLQARPKGFSRITNHETRNTAFMLFYPRFPTISHDFPAFPGPPPHPIKGPRAVRRSRWQPEVKPRVAPREVRRPADKERRGSILDIFDRGATQFRRDASPLNLHFSPRGEAKCVRGPSGLGASRAEEKGASRLARAGVLERYVEYGKQAQRRPGGRIACFDRRVVRNAG